MIGPGVVRTSSTRNGNSGAARSRPADETRRSNARFASLVYGFWRRCSMLMNHAGVRWRRGTRPSACSTKCETPTTRNPIGARSRSGSTAHELTRSSVRITMSGRCVSTISWSSSNEPRRGTSPAGASRPSPTSPSIVNGARPPRFSSSRTSAAHPPVPTTSTRRFAMLRTACSQAADSAKTIRAVSARATFAGVDPRHPEVEGRDGDEPRQRPGRRGNSPDRG